MEILGARLGRVDLRTLRPRVALVSGALTRQLRADLPAREVVASGRHGALETWWHTYTHADWDRADDLLARGGVGAIAHRPFGVISEGERQQVLLARALMSDPELVLLDEPFAGLDLGARETLLSRLSALATDPHRPPMVLVTHHCEEIPRGFTHGGLVREGRLIAAGPLQEVITSSPRVRMLRGAGRRRLQRRPVVEPRRHPAPVSRAATGDLIPVADEGTNEASGEVLTVSALCISPTIHHMERVVP